ncbi:hypothetical protein FJZ53_01700 [Candidatus Woesearchaeota archaeon]|nr:hypothetical protein [Candidatus Woesearchaeota archaeon]
MKQLTVTGITPEKKPLLYLSPIHKENPLIPFIDYALYNYVVECSGKKTIAKVIWSDEIYDTIVVSQGVAEKLKLKAYDKVSLKLTLLRKPDDDYLTLYEKNPKRFIKYFKEQSCANKKKILKELLEYDVVNEKVVSYLDKHESKLVREVGLE